MFPIRDTQPSFSKPFITVLLIAINVLAFLYEWSLDDYSQNAFVATYALIPENFHFLNIVTSMFLHGGWMHLLGNMWFLWIFGDNIEDILGHTKYLAFYLLCGVVAALTQVLFNLYSRVPMVGASGAIAGVMGAYMMKFPHSRIRTAGVFFLFIFFTDIPAWAMLIYWFGIQLFSGVGSLGQMHSNQGGTAFFAHIGGFIAGIVLVKLMGTSEPYARRRDLYWR